MYRFLFLTLLLSTGSLFAQQEVSHDSIREMEQSQNLFTESLRFLEQNHIRKDLSTDQLTFAALRGMLTSVDPHSQFLDPEAYKKLSEATSGEFFGIGVSLYVQNGHIYVLAAAEGSPAFQAGILPGDRILTINEKTIQQPSLDEVIQMLRGPQSSTVTVLTFRPSTEEVFQHQLVRDRIQVSSIPQSQFLPESLTGKQRIGYIQITEFNKRTSEDFSSQLKKLKQSSLQGLVIDLRNNPGGLVQSALDLCSQLLGEKVPIVITRGRNPSVPETTYRATQVHGDLVLPIVVLVNSYTASAAEITAGALQDNERALIIGEPSFGKGSIQTIQEINWRNDQKIGLKVSTSEYFTPRGKRINQVGVQPDILVTLTEEQELALFKMKNKNTSQEDANVADEQLLTAVAVLQGKNTFSKKQR
jgi:carboxyl-terminal processing protease